MNIRLRNRTKHTVMCKALLQNHAYKAKFAMIVLLSLKEESTFNFVFPVSGIGLRIFNGKGCR